VTPTNNYRGAQARKYAPATLVFELHSDSPELRHHLFNRHAKLAESYEQLRRAIPLPDRSEIEAEERFYRLAHHNRSFCMPLDTAQGVFSSACVVFKGVEPLLGDFDHMIDWMMISPFRSSTRVMAEHFPLAEGKIPGTVSLTEAIQEAKLAAEIHAKHLEHYQELARLPVPLVVYRYSEEDEERCRVTLLRKLPAVVALRVEELMRVGLGVYAYYYSVAPIRADAYGSVAKPKIRDYFSTRVSPRTTILRWISLLARLLYLGYVPLTPRHEGLGACMDMGNACLDGGFCDIESIQPIASCPDDEFFYESIISTLYTMYNTMEKLAVPDFGLREHSLYPNIEKFVLMRYLCALFEAALESERRPQLQLDSRVNDLLSPKTFDAVTALLRRKDRPRNFALYLRERGVR